MELSDGRKLTVSPAAYSSLLHSERIQEDREKVFRAHYGVYSGTANTYASIYNSILQRGWFHAQARGYATVLEAKLEGNAIPQTVLETLVSTVRGGTGPLQRYHQLRRKALKLESYHLYDGFLPIVHIEKKYPYETVRDLILDSVKPLGDSYVRKLSEDRKSHTSELGALDRCVRERGETVRGVFGECLWGASLHAAELPGYP